MAAFHRFPLYVSVDDFFFLIMHGRQTRVSRFSFLWMVSQVCGGIDDPWRFPTCPPGAGGACLALPALVPAGAAQKVKCGEKSTRALLDEARLGRI